VLHRHGVVPKFCTSTTPAANEAAATAAILAAGRGVLTQTARRARAGMSDLDWRTWRAACPPHLGPNPLDLDVAERLLADKSVYRAALPPPQLAAARDRTDSIGKNPLYAN
jgi:hypothetical protein